MRLSALVIAALMLLSPACARFARGQVRAEGVLVSARAQLSQPDVDRVIQLYEWALAVEFTADERETFQSYFVGAWQRGEKGAATLLKIAEKVLAMDASKLRRIQPEFRDAFLFDFNSEPDSATNRFLLGVYRRGHGGGSAAKAATVETASRQTPAPAAVEENEKRPGGEPDFRPAEGAVRMSELAGTWERGGVSSHGYRDAVTNDYRSGHGSANMHEIKADGSFEYSNYATVSLYNCTTELFTSMKGRVRGSGPRVNFTYVSGTVRGKDSCKAAGFNRPAQIEPKTYRVERDGARVRLCEVGAENPTCLYRADK